ncbi:TAXI family TRAP transporter solute-binding subunit [Aquisalimonas lutea]|uniref:TAXI family TRAP transporter solute-binding subunit n=1 Tax=Aquisalimonas lutea TaxID=1327750 RepID=UPI0025B299A9|nr:TAXI family TRAP transporter solute-binding subunit [Aquisalimonas lutea]MDN3517634.1 TAXI family TRAP transporter solute-binding subunit [Aquisalimonas lutea]
MTRKTHALHASAAAATGLALALGSTVATAEVELPGTIIWSAYPTGSSGYSQAVAIGQVLQNEYDTNLRVIPGRNDVSRLEPLRRDRADFSAGGTESVSAQDAQFAFGERHWGPQPVRSVMWSIADACSFTIAAAGDAGIDTAEDLEGKRVVYVQGAPSLNFGIQYLLNYAGLGWDDVERVEVGGYMGAVEAIIENRADAMGGSCNSAPFLRIDSSPRGLTFVEFPHDNEEGIQRVNQYAPWFVPHRSTQNVGMEPDEEIEVLTTPYPKLITMADQDADVVYNMVKAIHQSYDAFKDAAPGAEGWDPERMDLASIPVPFHEGAIRYYKEIGIWTDEAQANHERALERQEVLQEAWADYTADSPADREAFARGWMEARRKALEDNGFDPLNANWM